MPVRKRSYVRDGRKWVRFVATVEVAGEDRQRRSRSFRLEREARMWESQQRALIDAKQVTGSRTPALSAHLDAWLVRGSTRARKPWTPATRTDYEAIVKAHLKPKLGHIRLEDLTVDHVEAMLGGIPGNRAVNVRTALSSALSMAVKQRLIPYNMAKSADMPEVARSLGGGLSPEDARTFLAAVREHRLAALYTVSTALALRQSEAVGLRWADVELEARTLRVEQRIYRRGGEYHTGAPKSPKSRRTVHLPDAIVDVLREHRIRQYTERLGERMWEERGLVFPNTTGGPLYGPYVTRAMQRIMVQAGLEPRRFHDLRHTGASLLHAMGVDLKTIQEVLGHSDFRLTADTYTHVGDAVLRDAADRMDGFLGG